MRTSTRFFFCLILCLPFTNISFAIPGDIDDDGIADAVDNCKYSANTSQIDSDSDGQGDVCDLDDGLNEFNPYKLNHSKDSGNSILYYHLSPDANHVLYTSNELEDFIGDYSDIFHVSLSDNTHTQLAPPMTQGKVIGTPSILDPSNPVFTPDSNYALLGFIIATTPAGEDYEIHSISLTDFSSNLMHRKGQNGVYGTLGLKINVSPDSQNLVIHDSYVSPLPGNPLVYAFKNSKISDGTSVDFIPDGRGFFRSIISPDNQHVIYASRFASPLDDQLLTMQQGSLADGFTFQLTSDIDLVPFDSDFKYQIDISSISFTPDNTKILYVNSDFTNGDNLFVTSLTGTSTMWVDFIGGDNFLIDFNYSITADSNNVIYTDDIGVLYSTTLADGTRTQLNAPLPTGSAVSDFLYSDTQNSVIYVADQEINTKQELYRVSLADLSIVKINPPLPSTGDVYEIFLSENQRYLIYTADGDSDNVLQLYAYDFVTNSVKKLNVPFIANANVTDFKLTSDSRYVVYRADDDIDEQYNLFKVDIASGVNTKLNTNVNAGISVLTDFKIAADDTRVVYRADNASYGFIDLFSARLSDGKIRRLDDSIPSIESYKLADDGRLVVYETNDALYTVKLGNEDGLSITIPNNRWIQISFPYDPALGYTISSIFNGIFNMSDINRTWVVYDFDALNNRYIILNANSLLQPGKGYWLRQATGDEIEFSMQGFPVPVISQATNPNCPSIEGCYEVDLIPPNVGSQGWNMIGNPFDYEVKWTDVRIEVDGTQVCTPLQAQAISLLQDRYFHFNGSVYIQKSSVIPGDGSATLTPYEGYWLKLNVGATGKTMKLLIPKGVTSDSPTCLAPPAPP